MSSRAHQAALRIRLLQEEFSRSELAKAVSLLRRQSSAFSLLNYLAGDHAESAARTHQRRASKPLSKQRSRAVRDFEQKDPEKYDLLTRFDTLIREGTVPPIVEDIKVFGGSIRKDFAPVKSRKDAIGKLIAVLAVPSHEKSP